MYNEPGVSTYRYLGCLLHIILIFLQKQFLEKNCLKVDHPN